MEYKNVYIELSEGREFKLDYGVVKSENGFVFKTNSLAGQTYAITSEQALSDAYRLIDQMYR